MLNHHARLHDQHKEEDQERIFLVVVRKVEQQQGRHMAHAVDADHDAPLQLGIALQEALRVVGQRTDQRNDQEHVDRDEHREQVEALVADQRVLDRQHHEERQHQAAVVATARW